MLLVLVLYCVFYTPYRHGDLVYLGTERDFASPTRISACLGTLGEGIFGFGSYLESDEMR